MPFRGASCPIIRPHPDDNIVVARTDIPIGALIDGEGQDGARINSRSQVPAGYKIASTRILKGEPVRKYNVVIGFAAADIEPGTMVHNDNMDFREFDRDYAHASEYRPVQPVAPPRAGLLRRHRARRRTRGHAQLHRRAVHRQLLGHGGSPHRRLVHARTFGGQVGGLANIFEKSLGSSMKGRTGPLMAVYRYAEPVTQSGFVFMDTPGFDPVSATGQIAGGANLISFTTGRGSMFGAKPAPCIKLATNTPMFRRLEEDMDINCGEILDGTASMQEMAERIFQHMLETASARRSKSEPLGLGDNEFVPWQIGIMS